MSVYLATVPCSRCSAPCLSAPSYWVSGQALCQECRPAPAVQRTPWRPTIARVLPAPVEREVESTSAQPRYRVLVPSREAAPSEISKAPRAALDSLQDGIGEQAVWVTYACAEDTERGELVRTIALRVRRLGVAGYGCWEDGGWSSGLSTHPSPHLCGSLEEWLAHICGKDWAPPPPCPRCGRPGVRRKADGELYKHRHMYWRIPMTLECI